MVYDCVAYLYDRERQGDFQRRIESVQRDKQSSMVGAWVATVTEVAVSRADGQYSA